MRKTIWRIAITIIVISMLDLEISTAIAADEKVMECRRWVVENNKRVFITKFVVRLDTALNKITIDEDLELKYPLTKKYGEWKMIWVSENKLRVVAFGIGDDVELNSPVSVFDFDFSEIRMRFESFGGIVNFDPIISRPNYECKRID